MASLLAAIIAACNAYVVAVKLQRETEIDRIEDEIDKLASIGDAASKLRIERLAARKQRKIKQFGAL
jgi:hypothetical protein